MRFPLLRACLSLRFGVSTVVLMRVALLNDEWEHDVGPALTAPQ
jgi:hypothetical protein